jgi:hypothetical protein
LGGKLTLGLSRSRLPRPVDCEGTLVEEVSASIKRLAIWTRGPTGEDE